MRIFGPCRSAMIPTSLPSFCAASRTWRARSTWSEASPCEKLRRTTTTPAASMRSSTSGSLQAGPRVATILVARSKRNSGSGRMAADPEFYVNSAEPGPRWPINDEGEPPRVLRRRARLQHRHRRQRLAFQEFEEGASGGRDIRDPVGNSELVDRGYRVGPAGDRERARSGDGFRQSLGPRGERVELEDADGTVPDDGARLGDDGLQRRDRRRTDIENHIVGLDVLDGLLR